MCGIAGFVGARADGEQVLKRMLHQLRRRGPDGEGIEIFDNEVFLGHRRLSIIDLEGGRQPMANEDGSLWLTFNGEIFNFRELREELIAKGHEFRTQSDSEVILHLFEEFGPQGFERLNGMFAFALWDRKRKELVLVRDRFGIKPIYYAELPNGGIAFASELTALVAHPEVDFQISQDDLKSYLFSDYTIGPSTILKGVRKLLPGQFLDGSGEAKSYWSPWSLRTEGKERTEAEWIDETRARLETAVERQLVSDVPVGAFLSGGIDSSVITCMAAKHGPIKTFAIGFEQKSFDESAFAKDVADQIGSEHFEQIVNEQLLLENLDDALDSLDEPLGDSSILPTYLVSKFAAERVKVVMGGDGGDEMFGGYPTYLAHKMAWAYSAIPSWIRSAIIERVIRSLRAKTSYMSLEFKLKRFALRWDKEPMRRHLRWMSSTDVPDINTLFGDESFDPPIFDHVDPEALRGDLTDWMLTDFTTYMPGSVLTKVDRASMANGLEVRPPFLDHDLVDLAFQVPPKLKIKGRTT
ncbi:MAG: asparagine synthase (glutamine-hydrolyzing), partial [Verrucomicrobiales bacterium]